MLCVEQGKGGRQDIIIQPSGIRLPWVFHHLSLSLSNPIGFPFEWKHPPFASSSFGSLSSSCSSLYQFCLVVGDKSSGTRKRKKKNKPFCCVCRGPIKLPVAFNLLQQQQLFDHGISFPFFLIISQPSARSVTVTHVELLFGLFSPLVFGLVLVTTWLVISFQEGKARNLLL